MRWLIGTLLALMLFALLWTPAAACKLMSAYVRVDCPGDVPVVANNHDEILPQLSPTCIAALGAEVRQLIAERQSQVKNPYTETHFKVAPWVAADEDRLRAAQEADLLGCRYQRWQRVGDWLITEDAVRTYCDSTPSSGMGTCPGAELWWGRFLIFAFRYPSQQTLPFVLGVALGVLGVGFWLIRVIRRGQLADLLLRSRGFGLLFATMLVLIFFNAPLPWAMLALAFLIIYLLVCTVSWMRARL